MPLPSKGASASAAAASISAELTAGIEGSELAYSAAPMPARRPKTMRSESEFPPRRFEPCMPPATSPAANRPATVEAVLSASTRTPPIT